VSPRPASLPSSEELLEHLRGIFGALTIKVLRKRMKELREIGSEAALAELRESHLRRIWDMSAFMKALKQQFTQWFNRRHGRKGTLWKEHFKACSRNARATPAACIDLRPVRAGLCDDPKA
jgi:hypothetical protein